MRRIEVEIPKREVAALAALLVQLSEPVDGSPVDLQEVLETLVSDLASAGGWAGAGVREDTLHRTCLGDERDKAYF